MSDKQTRTYSVKVHEQATYRVVVKAKSADEAELKAEEAYLNADSAERDAMCIAVYDRQTEIEGV
jgi:hypothetical protein